MLVVRDHVLSRAHIYYHNSGAFETSNAVGIGDVALRPMVFYRSPFPFRGTCFDSIRKKEYSEHK